MKTFLKLLSVLFVCLLIVPLAVACGGKNDTDTTTLSDLSTTEPPITEPAAAPLSLVTEGKTSYVIVRPIDLDETAVAETNAAISLSNAFKAATGSSVAVTTDWERNAVKELEICVGTLTRNGQYYDVDTSALSDNEFIVKVCDTRLVLVGKTTYGTKKAVDWFIETYLNADDGTITELAVPGDFSYVGQFELSTTLRIMTQNVLATDEEYAELMENSFWASRITADLSKHTLAVRQPRILSLIKTYQPDSLGVQECSSDWRKYFDSNLRSIGYERIGASKNEKIGIIYHVDTVKPIANGSIWLTENPEKLKISEEWGAEADGLTERLAMYVVFEMIATGDRYIHFNTHLDTGKNSIIQTKQTEVLLDYIETICEKYGNIPAVCTGDFNYNSSHTPYTTLVSSFMGDTKYMSAASDGAGSFNKFVGKEYASLPIDQVLATKDGFDCMAYQVVYDTFDGCFASDHYAVYADMSIKTSD